MTARRTRLTVLASHPIQYFTPLYRRLARHPELDVEVLFCRDFGVRAQYDKQFGRAIAWDTDQLAGYRHRFLRNLSPITDTFNPLHAVNPGAFTRMFGGVDAVWMNGYMYPSNWMAAAGAKLAGSRVLLRSELRLAPDRHARRTDALRDAVIRGWVRASDALLYIGAANREAYLAYGARPSQLFFSPYSADVPLLREARAAADAEGAAARARYGVAEGRVVIAFVGKLTERKHPEAVLALANDPALRDRVHLVFAGSGPLEGELAARIAADRLTNVTMLGFVNQRALPEVYAVADLFVMPSEREPWGLVLNEAMAAGAVPVVSDAVGAAADLIRDDETGFAFPSLDWEAMRGAVEQLVRDDALRARMRAAAEAHAGAYSHDAAAAGVVEALRSLGLAREPLAPAGGAVAEPARA